MGIMPLVFAHGAGASSRHSLGTAVAGGMVVSSILSAFICVLVVLRIRWHAQAEAALAQKFASRR